MERARDALLREPSFSRAVVIDCVFTTVLALVFLLGGPGRWTAPAFAFMHGTGGNLVWGVLLGAGVAVIAYTARRSTRAMRWALWVGACVHALYGAAFLLAAASDYRASFVGGVLFMWNATRLLNHAQSLREG